MADPPPPKWVTSFMDGPLVLFQYRVSKMDWEHFKKLFNERDTHHIISVSKRKMSSHLDAFWQIKFSEKISLSFFTPHFLKNILTCSLSGLNINSLFIPFSESKLSFKLLIQTLKCSYIVSIRYICIYIHLYTPTNRPIWENTITT